MTRTIRALAGLAVATTCLVGCTVKKQGAPPLSGPSELATAISLSANPDTLRQDGSSQSQIVVIALDSKGQPVRSLPVRLDISVNGTIMDFGQVSARNVVTSADGRASVVYTAPLPPADPVDNGLVIQILATPTGYDYGNATTRAVNIRLVPPGIILPPNGTPTPRFVFSPSAPVSKTDVTFDATSSTDDGQIVSYAWNFGDTTTGSGPIARHKFDKGGSYTVTLTITDDRGLSASITAIVVVTETTDPEASFVFSPMSPLPNQDVIFNAGASRAGPGRTIVSYQWEFGTGGSAGTGNGVTVTKRFSNVATYVVTLTATDDVGNKGTTSQSVSVKAPSLTPSFVFSPQSPALLQKVHFDASGSTTDVGHTIEAYDWNFGDKGTGSGRTTNHTFVSNGSYNVTLTIRDDSGVSASIAKTVTVSSGDIVAEFTFSPVNPAAGSLVFFNAEMSRSLFGLTAWEWDFGDGNRGTGQTASHAYTTAGTYTVVLTVRDNMGRTANTSHTVTVASTPSTPPTAKFVFSPASPAPLQSVFFDASESTAAAGRTIASYAWSFGVASATGTGKTASYTYANDGVYTVVLTVTDDIGQVGTVPHTVTVGSAPNAAFTVSPSPATINQPVTVDASTSTPQATIVSYEWNFGDSTQIFTTASRTFTHQYDVIGSYTITLRVTDTAGRKASATNGISVGSGIAPTANFTFAPSPGVVGAAITFDGSSSTGTITRQEWVFGDTTTVFSVTSAPWTIPHTYLAAGSYSVTLTVIDNVGLLSRISKAVIVQ